MTQKPTDKATTIFPRFLRKQTEVRMKMNRERSFLGILTKFSGVHCQLG